MTTNQTTMINEHIRQLSQDEVKLLEEIAFIGPQLDDLCRRVRAHIIAQWEAANMRSDGNAQFEVMRIAQAEPLAWLANGKMKLQEGLIGLTRAVSQPGFF